MFIFIIRTNISTNTIRTITMITIIIMMKNVRLIPLQIGPRVDQAQVRRSKAARQFVRVRAQAHGVGARLQHREDAAGALAA